MDAATDDLRHAHDVLADWHTGRLPGVLESMPIERAVLNLFSELTLAAGLGNTVADVGCRTGRLTPYLASRGLTPRGIDLSPTMIDIARRDHPAFPFPVAGLRDLPIPDACLAGVVCWYPLIFLAPPDRTVASAELARVLHRGGHLVTAFKDGDGAAGAPPDGAWNSTPPGYPRGRRCTWAPGPASTWCSRQPAARKVAGLPAGLPDPT